MAELRERTVIRERPVYEDRPVIIHDTGEREGAGTGMALGVFLAIMLVFLVIGVAFAGRLFNGGVQQTPVAPANGPTINIQPPSIKVPDTITVNPPAQPSGSGSGSSANSGQ